MIGVTASAPAMQRSPTADLARAGAAHTDTGGEPATHRSRRSRAMPPTDDGRNAPPARVPGLRTDDRADAVPDPARRRALAGLAGASAVPLLGRATAGVAAASSAAAPATVADAARTDRWTSSFVQLDPVEQFRQVMRVQRSLEDADDILHWYHFVMIAVPVGATPKPVVRWEGIEYSRHERVGEHRYRLHGHNLSFPRDLRTGEWVDAVVNPVTNERASVPPMKLTGDPGLVRSPEGTVTLDRPDAPPRLDYRVLRRESDVVKVDAIRVPPDTWPVTFLEIGHEWTSARAFDDARLKWLPAEVSGGYVFPWPEWMGMGKAPGHMFATWSGYKLRGPEQLPEEFRRRAEADAPDLLRVDRAPFAKPLPKALTG
jgi:hypothetical protein